MKRKLKRLFIGGVLGGFILLNIVAYNHAYHFTHFGETSERTAKPEQLSLGQRLGVLFTGVSIPKPQNLPIPSDYVSLKIPSRDQLKMEGWLSKKDSSLADTGRFVLLVHGYAGEKSSLLPQAKAFRAMGYRSLLIDLLGHGGAEGSETSLGYHEAEDVIAAVGYAKKSLGAQTVVLYGFSMGAITILKAARDSQGLADALIMAAPFGRMRQTVANRFDLMGVPSFPFADALVFWGGLQHGYWAFGHNSVDYATEVSTPTLVLHGGQDTRARLPQAQEVFDALSGEKQFHCFEELAHQCFVCAEPQTWHTVVGGFLRNFAAD